MVALAVLWLVVRTVPLEAVVQTLVELRGWQLGVLLLLNGLVLLALNGRWWLILRGLDWANGVALATAVCLMLLGTGPLSPWKPEERFLLRRAGEA